MGQGCCASTLENRNLFAETLLTRGAVGPKLIVELQPLGFNVAALIRETLSLAAAGAQAISIAEHPLGQLYPDAIAVSHLVQASTGVPVLPHLTSGHRNLLATEGTLLGAHVLNVRTLLALTGDPLGLRYPAQVNGITRVRDVKNCFEMLALIRTMNGGKDAFGRMLATETDLLAGVAFDANVVHLDKAVARLEKKVLAGGGCVRLVISQMLFDPHKIDAMCRSLRHLGLPLFASIMPLISVGSACFIDRHITRVPKEVIERLRLAEQRAGNAIAEGLTICKELLAAALESGADGVYFIAPTKRPELIQELLQYATSGFRSMKRACARIDYMAANPGMVGLSPS